MKSNTNSGRYFPFRKQLLWKSSPGSSLIAKTKLSVCGIKCECLGVFSYGNAITIDLYSEQTPRDFIIFHIDESKINEVHCEVLHSLAIKQSESHSTHGEVVELCKQYGKTWKKESWMQRIVLSSFTDVPAVTFSLSLLRLCQQNDNSILCEFGLTKDGMIYTYDFHSR